MLKVKNRSSGKAGGSNAIIDRIRMMSGGRELAQVLHDSACFAETVSFIVQCPSLFCGARIEVQRNRQIGRGFRWQPPPLVISD